MKFNMKVFNKGKPIYWIIGGIFIFVVFYYFISKGSAAPSNSSGSGITTINAGPSDTAIAAQAGVAMAQIQANAQVDQSNAALIAAKDANAASVAITAYQFQGDLAATQAGADVAKYLGALDAQVQVAGLTAQTAWINTQSEYSFATAKVAAETDYAKAKLTADSNLAQWALNADVLKTQLNTQAEIATTQLTTQAQMFTTQIEGLTQQSLISQISSAPEVDRDNLIALMAASLTGTGITYSDRGSGSFTTQPRLA